MIVPVRCFNCGKVIGDKWQSYLNLLLTDNLHESEVVDGLGLVRYCCRMHLITHANIIDTLLEYTYNDDRRGSGTNKDGQK